jgi:HAE1 family hydrophobic/amphiphilic exporter-1
MTSLAMIIGLLPIALSKGAGAEWKNGMAWALIGGLSSSLLLNFIVVPIIYLGINKIFRKQYSTIKDKSELV